MIDLQQNYFVQEPLPILYIDVLTLVGLLIDDGKYNQLMLDSYLE